MNAAATGPVEPTILPVILAGGSGTRLWPASRVEHPKQLLHLSDEYSLLQGTVARLKDPAGCRLDDRLVVVTNAEYRFTIARELRVLGFCSSTIVLEPAGRNTAPALTVAALLTLPPGRGSERPADADASDPVLLVMPADHVIEDQEAFQAAMAEGCRLAQEGAVVTFGIVPQRAETSYGYIRLGEALPTGTARRMADFTEKPDVTTAAHYLKSGEYLWNSGIFMLRRSVWLAAIEEFAPQIHRACEAACEEARYDGDFVWIGQEQFLSSPSDSIDYAVMKRLLTASHNPPALVIPLDAGWSDVGAWDGWWQVAQKDADGNTTRGDVFVEHCHGSLVHAGHRMVVAVGCDEMVVVETADAVLVAPMREAQAVKQAVDHLAHERPEITQTHRRVFRPWGSYDSIDSGDRFQVKHIVVDPGASISLQYHLHRAEHWVVVRGTAQVTKGDEVFLLTENQSTYVPAGEIHRLANMTDAPLEIIEIQSGEYLGEDDIVRLKDDYNR